MSEVPEHVEAHDEVQFDKAARYVLMPVDGSENSERAFLWYVNNLHKPTDGIYLIHIVEPTAGSSVNYNFASKAAAMSDELTRQIGDLIENGRKLGKRYLEMCRSKNVAAKFTLHIGSKPGEHIVRLSRELNINIVIMGSRGLGTIRRTFMGSVSDHILHHVSLPVIVIPPPKNKK